MERLLRASANLAYVTVVIAARMDTQARKSRARWTQMTRARSPWSRLAPSASAVAVLLLAGGCGGPPEAPPFAPPVVDTMVLGAPEPRAIRQFPGEVRADQRAELAFRVSGPLVQLPIQEGEQVAAGQLLARIDPRDFDNQRQLARGGFHRVARAVPARDARARFRCGQRGGA
jgi:multidrug efflux pump subunit AcrA (membrane-fusion protein)